MRSLTNNIAFVIIATCTLFALAIYDHYIDDQNNNIIQEKLSKINFYIANTSAKNEAELRPWGTSSDNEKRNIKIEDEIAEIIRETKRNMDLPKKKIEITDVRTIGKSQCSTLSARSHDEKTNSDVRCISYLAKNKKRGLEASNLLLAINPGKLRDFIQKKFENFKTLWVYTASEEGAIAIWPATREISENYITTTRPWHKNFVRTLKENRKSEAWHSFTPSYPDLFNKDQKSVVTFCFPKGHPDTEEIFAVCFDLEPIKPDELTEITTVSLQQSNIAQSIRGSILNKNISKTIKTITSKALQKEKIPISQHATKYTPVPYYAVILAILLAPLLIKKQTNTVVHYERLPLNQENKAITTIIRRYIPKIAEWTAKINILFTTINLRSIKTDPTKKAAITETTLLSDPPAETILVKVVEQTQYIYLYTFKFHRSMTVLEIKITSIQKRNPSSSSIRLSTLTPDPLGSRKKYIPYMTFMASFNRLTAQGAANFFQDICSHNTYPEIYFSETLPNTIERIKKFDTLNTTAERIEDLKLRDQVVTLLRTEEGNGDLSSHKNSLRFKCNAKNLSILFGGFNVSSIIRYSDLREVLIRGTDHEKREHSIQSQLEASGLWRNIYYVHSTAANYERILLVTDLSAPEQPDDAWRFIGAITNLIEKEYGQLEANQSSFYVTKYLKADKDQHSKGGKIYDRTLISDENNDAVALLEITDASSENTRSVSRSQLMLDVRISWHKDLLTEFRDELDKYREQIKNNELPEF